MTKDEVAVMMTHLFEELQALREAGQTEYAHRDENAFANFERVAERTGISREAVLMVYLEKHIDGIHSYVKGHRSQREDVRGRIKDAIVYLILLHGMIIESPVHMSEGV
jgi:predicted AAA+ superfamily ATPase